MAKPTKKKQKDVQVGDTVYIIDGPTAWPLTVTEVKPFYVKARYHPGIPYTSRGSSTTEHTMSYSSIKFTKEQAIRDEMRRLRLHLRRKQEQLQGYEMEVRNLNRVLKQLQDNNPDVRPITRKPKADG